MFGMFLRLRLDTYAHADWAEYWLHESLLQSCQVIFWGFFWSALLGIPLGILCGTFSLFSRLVEPFIDFVRYMPAPVFGALAVAVLGLGDESKVNPELLPRALFWFRWGAAWTWVSGLLLLALVFWHGWRGGTG